MIRTQQFPCALPKAEADRLNQESGRLYTRALVEHYRVYRQTGHWLSSGGLEKLVDFYETQAQHPRLLHAHSIDAAEQGFPKACKTAKANRWLGARYPYKRKAWRTTIWKNTGLRKDGQTLLLALARGCPPLRVNLPTPLVGLSAEAFVEMRLVWDKAAYRYNWHVVIDDQQAPAEQPGEQLMAGDLGEVHPITLTDGETTTIISVRALRSVRQYTNKRLAKLQTLQAHKTKHSRRWRKLQRRKNRFLAYQKRRTRDMEHKVSCAVVACARQAQVGTLVLGDVRQVADGKRLNSRSQQKISNWSHGQVRAYIRYKAEAAGIQVELIDEAYTSQTCPNCGERHKPKGRRYCCPACGFRSHRDAVGAANILSRRRYGALGKIKPPVELKYRHPFCNRKTGKRSLADTKQVAWGIEST